MYVNEWSLFFKNVCIHRCRLCRLVQRWQAASGGGWHPSASHRSVGGHAAPRKEVRLPSSDTATISIVDSTYTSTYTYTYHYYIYYQ